MVKKDIIILMHNVLKIECNNKKSLLNGLLNNPFFSSIQLFIN